MALCVISIFNVYSLINIKRRRFVQFYIIGLLSFIKGIPIK